MGMAEVADLAACAEAFETAYRTASLRLTKSVASGSAVAQSLEKQAPAAPRESLPNRYEPPLSETDFRLGDHQQLRGYFLDGSRDRLR